MKKALRYNKGKPKWSLVDFEALEPLVRTLEHGLEKYGKDNWKLGLDQEEVLNSLSRHLFALMSGETIDKPSGCTHIGAILANAMFWSYENNKVEDTVVKERKL